MIFARANTNTRAFQTCSLLGESSFLSSLLLSQNPKDNAYVFNGMRLVFCAYNNNNILYLLQIIGRPR